MPGIREDEHNQEEVVEAIGDEAAMAAAFSASASGQEIITGQPEEVAPAEAEAPAAVTEEPATPSAPPASGPTPDQLALLATIPELERRLTSQVDKVAGNYGEVKRLLESIKQAAATPEGAANADEEWAELNQEFPELAQSVTKGVNAAVQRSLQRALMGLGNVAVTPDAVREAIAAETERERKERQAEDLKLLNKVHPDRLELQKTPEWGQWLDTLSPIRRAKTLTTDDLEYVSDRLDDFKKFLADKKAAHAASANRIEDAVTPQGSGNSARSTLSEAEEMQKAFAEAIKS